MRRKKIHVLSSTSGLYLNKSGQGLTPTSKEEDFWSTGPVKDEKNRKQSKAKDVWVSLVIYSSEVLFYFKEKPRFVTYTHFVFERNAEKKQLKLKDRVCVCGQRSGSSVSEHVQIQLEI